MSYVEKIKKRMDNSTIDVEYNYHAQRQIIFKHVFKPIFKKERSVFLRISVSDVNGNNGKVTFEGVTVPLTPEEQKEVEVYAEALVKKEDQRKTMLREQLNKETLARL